MFDEFNIDEVFGEFNINFNINGVCQSDINEVCRVNLPGKASVVARLFIALPTDATIVV